MGKYHEKRLVKWLAREKAANRAKDQFLAVLSHELRTPLNPALLLASDGAHNDALPLEVRKDFDMICRNIETEARLIDDLLDLTRIASGKLVLNRNTVDVHAVLGDVVSIIDKEIEQKHIFLQLRFRAAHHQVLGDPVRLKQIFWNVLKNAVKFTAANGQITVETDTISNHKVVIRISDTGIGMNQEEIRTVFDKFSQGPHGMGGLGLGLAISRKLVKLHSGTIHATSLGKGKGAEFSIIFPALKSDEEKLQLGPAPVRRAQSKGNGNGNMRKLLS